MTISLDPRLNPTALYPTYSQTPTQFWSVSHRILCSFQEICLKRHVYDWRVWLRGHLRLEDYYLPHIQFGLQMGDLGHSATTTGSRVKIFKCPSDHAGEPEQADGGVNL